MSLRHAYITLVEPRPDEVEWLLAYARRLAGADPHPIHSEQTRAQNLEHFERWLDEGEWFSACSCFEGGGCGPGEPWHEHNRQRIAVWRDSADKTDPEQVAFNAWAKRDGVMRDEDPPAQTWATLTWPKVRALLRARRAGEQLAFGF